MPLARRFLCWVPDQVPLTLHLSGKRVLAHDAGAPIRRQAAPIRQFARETSTRLSENDGAWPMSVKAPDEMLFTVPSLSWRQ